KVEFQPARTFKILGARAVRPSVGVERGRPECRWAQTFSRQIKCAWSAVPLRPEAQLAALGGRPIADRLCGEVYMSIVWTIIIGFVAGVIAKLLHPGPNEPSGFVLTTILGIVGALVATYVGQAIGWYQAGEGAGLIGAIVGAVIVLLVWGLVAGRNRAT